MRIMIARLTEPIWHRYLPIILLIIALTALGSAYTAEFLYSLEPCVLCNYQRIPFAILGVLSLLAFLFEGRVAMTAITALAGVVLLIGAGISMASYNAVFSGVLGLGGLWAAIRMRAG